MFAQVLYAMFLAPDQAEKQRLLEEVIDYTEQAGPLVKADIVAQFGSVYAKARLAEELSVPVVLKRGYTSEIPKELDALLARQPNQPFALALYGGYEAGVIRKVGKLVGKMTYGVSADKMEQYFARSFRQANDLPIGHYEYANALTYVYGDDEREKAIAQLKQAVAIADQRHGSPRSGPCEEAPRRLRAEHRAALKRRAPMKNVRCQVFHADMQRDKRSYGVIG